MSGRTLSLKDKIEIINYYEENKPTLRTLATTFNIGKTLASKIVKDKDKIIEQSKAENEIVKDDNPYTEDDKKIYKEGKKSNLSPQGKIIDKLCYEWYLNAKRQNQAVSGKLLKEKALEVALTMGVSNFGASNGWLQRWRIRHDVHFKNNDKTETTPTDPVENFETLYQNFLQKHISNHAGTNACPETENFIKNAWESVKKETIDKYFVKPNLLKKESQSNGHNTELNVFSEESIDPLSLFEVNLKEEHQDEEMVNEQEKDAINFQIYSYESALIAITSLKNFAFTDKKALRYLTKVEHIFQEKLNA